MSEPTDTVSIAVSYQNPADYEEITASIVGEDGKYSFEYNTELIAYQTGIMPDSIGDVVTIMVIIAAVIIILTAVFCIRNSFAISINEKIRQYGMLASVGATSKQIKRNVLFESAVLGLIAIPIGVAGGIFAVFALCKVSSAIMSSIDQVLNSLQASIRPLFVVCSVLLACLTIFLSSIGSAIKASKISEIDAIRNTNEIKIKRRTTKVPKIINKLFGIGGVFAYKNLKRNRKKFTTTTIALVVSIVTFISLSYYIGLGFEMAQTEFELLGYNLYVRNTSDAVVNYASALDGIDEVTVAKDIRGINQWENEDYTPIQIVCFDDDSYKEFLDDNSIEYDENKVVVYDYIAYGMVDGKTIYANLFEEIGQIDSINLFIGDVYDENMDFVGEESGIEKIELEYVRAETLTTGLYSGIIYVIMSDDQFDKYVDYSNQSMVSTTVYLYCQDPYATEYSILDFMSEEGYTGSVTNAQSLEDITETSLMLVSIFAFGFIAVIILVGLTNIFNSLSANMKLRKKEFAMLQSIGMTKNEFNKMIRFESICYVAKSLLIGVPLGSIISYIIYYFATNSTTYYTYTYNFPIIQVIACSVVVFFIVYAIMKTSLNKISKQNVIETIRQENV